MGWASMFEDNLERFISAIDLVEERFTSDLNWTEGRAAENVSSRKDRELFENLSKDRELLENLISKCRRIVEKLRRDLEVATDPTLDVANERNRLEGELEKCNERVVNLANQLKKLKTDSIPSPKFFEANLATIYCGSKNDKYNIQPRFCRF